MRKRMISLVLAVAMLLSMASSLTVSVRAASKTHYCFEGSALCEELPAAYRAMQVEDAENFFCHVDQSVSVLRSGVGGIRLRCGQFPEKDRKQSANHAGKGS